MEPTASPMLSLLAPTAGLPGLPDRLDDLPKTSVITDANAALPADSFLAVLNQLTLPQETPATITVAESTPVLPIIAPVIAAEVLPPSGKPLPLPLALVADPGEKPIQQTSPVSTQAPDEILEQLADLQALPAATEIPLVAAPIVAPEPGVVTSSPVVSTVLANAVLPKPAANQRPVPETTPGVGTRVDSDARPAVANGILRELPANPARQSDAQQITAPQTLQAIVPESVNTPVPTVANATLSAPQQTSLSTAPAPTPSLNLQHPVTDAQWGNSLGQRILWMTENGMGRAEIRLNPAELGPLNVSVTVANDEAKVAFNVQHGTTRELVEAALPRLRELFAAQGLELTDATVSQNSPEDRRQTTNTADSSTQSNSRDPQSTLTPDTPPPSPLTHEGLIDTYA